MNKIKVRFKGDCLLFSIGAIAYTLIEILWRNKTHWSMAITGGACFTSIFRLYKRFTRLTLAQKCILGSAVITAMEFCCGCIVNIKYKLNVWDYSKCKFNYKGQICLLYSFLWGLLCIPISGICNLLNGKKSWKKSTANSCR